MCQGHASATLWRVPAIEHYEAIRLEIVRLLREERLRRGLSNYAVSQNCGVSESMLSLVEHGERNPTMELMLRIADGIGANLPAVMKRATVIVGETRHSARSKSLPAKALTSGTAKSKH